MNDETEQQECTICNGGGEVARPAEFTDISDDQKLEYKDAFMECERCNGTGKEPKGKIE